MRSENNFISGKKTNLGESAGCAPALPTGSSAEDEAGTGKRSGTRAVPLGTLFLLHQHPVPSGQASRPCPHSQLQTEPYDEVQWKLSRLLRSSSADPSSSQDTGTQRGLCSACCSGHCRPCRGDSQWRSAAQRLYRRLVFSRRVARVCDSDSSLTLAISRTVCRARPGWAYWQRLLGTWRGRK